MDERNLMGFLGEYQDKMMGIKCRYEALRKFHDKQLELNLKLYDQIAENYEISTTLGERTQFKRESLKEELQRTPPRSQTEVDE